MFTLIGCGIGLVVVGVGVYKIWKNKGMSTADKIAKTAEEAAKAAVLAKEAKEGYWKK